MPLELLVECRDCGGTGEVLQEGGFDKPCAPCIGTGMVLETVKSGVRDLFCLSCDKCNGQGGDKHGICGQCEGSGHYYRLADGRLAIDPVPEEAS